MKKSISIALLASLIGTAAMAHPGHGAIFTFSEGLEHPTAGFDHILAMIGIGLWASFYKDAKGLLLPAGFVGGMLLGVVFAVMGVALPMVENIIALSVIMIGLALAFKDKVPVYLAATIALFAGTFHGFAHGAEASNVALSYVAGFMISTILMHAFGGFAGLKFKALRNAAPYIGGFMGIAGLLMLAS
jgi:urease accessory protein